MARAVAMKSPQAPCPALQVVHYARP